MEKATSTIVVTGPPRSGTSLLMQMLCAGGIEVITDDHRQQDIDNPRGYFEHQLVKNLAQDSSLFERSSGKAVKVIHALLKHIPRELPLAVLFLERDLGEVLASQSAMLERMKRPAQTLPVDRMREALARQLAVAREELKSRPNTIVLDIQHRHLIDDPNTIARQIAEFLEPALGRLPDVGSMVLCVDPSLYRQRKG
jgi:hypothetical protein